MTTSMDALLAGAPSASRIEEAYALCERLAKTHYENFSVGSWFLPRESRKHLYAVYAICRFVDASTPCRGYGAIRLRRAADR